MTSYSDFSDLLNAYNFTGIPDNTDAVPSITLSQDEDDNYIVRYTILQNATDVSNTGYYPYAHYPNFNDSIATTSYKANVETAFSYIMEHNFGSYSVLFQDVAKIVFDEADSGTGEIAIAQLTDDGYADDSTSAVTIPYDAGNTNASAVYGDIWINTEHDSLDNLPGGFNVWDVDATIAPGTAAFKILLEEISHALGVDIYAPNGTPRDSALDSQKYSVTSYNSHPDMDYDGVGAAYFLGDALGPFPKGLQLFDIAALQEIYGRQYDTRHTNTTYSAATAFASDQSDDSFVYTIWDGGGTDLVDASAYEDPVQIDLRQGHFSSIGKDGADNAVVFDAGGVDHGNVAIAYYAVIENANGTSGEDILIGNEWKNILHGGGGADHIYQDGASYDGTDSFHANDTNRPGPNADENSSGNDILLGGEGDDILYGGLGTNILHGGFVAADIAGVDSGWDVAGQFSELDDIDYVEDGFDTADYSKFIQAASVAFGENYDINNPYLLYETTGDGVAQAVTGWGVGIDTLFSIEKIIGTENRDVFYVRNEMSNTGEGPLVLEGASGADVYYVDGNNAAGVVQINDEDVHIVGVYDLTSEKYIYGHSTTVGGIEYYDIDFSTSAMASPYLTLRLPEDAIGIERFWNGAEYDMAGVLYYLNSVGAPMYANAFHTGISAYAYNTGAHGAGGTTAEFDGSGNALSQKVSPSVGGSPISTSVAEVTYNPFVITSFSQSYSMGAYSSSATWETYNKSFTFAPDISPDDIRLTASGSQGAAALTIHIDSLSYSVAISDFETGHTINGIQIYDATMHEEIHNGSSSSLTFSGSGVFGGSYTSLTGLSVDPYATVSVTYYLETLNFVLGSIDLSAPLTFTGSASSETLTGLDDRADTIFAMGGADYIYGYGGNDTITGGAGDDQLYGGVGNDTYRFESGFGSDYVTESTSEGTDTIRFVGIAPSDFRMYTDSSGYLHIVQISNSSNNITVIGGTTGAGTYESTIGTRVESVTFDSGFSTTWDLTGGLTITGGSGVDALYGTAYADTINGMGGADTIYGNTDNDTITGGAGADDLYGGTGNDTYRFEAGFGADYVTESASEGTDTIRFVGIDPSDIRMYTDTSGYLHLVQISNPSNSITVVAATTGYNYYESTVGTRVESVTFDSGYSTTWDLTGGLTITGSSGNESLYGTAYADTIYGMAAADTIYGNGDNDTITGGAGADDLYGGTGNDTYRFESGFGADYVTESASEGTDTIRFVGIDPADIRMYTDTSGYLHLVQISNSSNNIIVVASTTGSGNYESTIGTRVESVTFDSGYSTTWDLTGGLTITGSSGAEGLYGTAYADTMYGMGGADTIYGNAGNDIIYGGAGGDQLYGNSGNDTYRFESGFGADYVTESASEGTDAIRFVGIDPADIRMYTDTSGYLHLVQISDPSNSITLVAGVTGSGNYESTIGTLVESVTFDSGYSTTWDLTGALTLTGSSTAESLYGTAYADTIYGMGGADTIYGNAGNDIIYGGAGGDQLYGNTGNDTYRFESGFGADYVTESASEGTDTIRFVGIDPADIRMYTDTSGYLHLVQISDPSNSITLVAGVTGSGNYESTIGTLVESVTFDAGYSTTWDLTGGLIITGSSTAEGLYGTAYGDTITGGGGADTIYGNAGNDTITGGSSGDTLYGNDGNDLLYGAAGTDYLTGGSGSDTFVFKNATALGASDYIADFNTGQGDAIDIADVLDGYWNGTDPIADFVALTTSGSDTLLKVDLDGTGGTYGLTQIATIQGVTGLSLNDLISNDNLIVQAA